MSDRGEVNPERIHTLAVRTDDLLDALEARERTDRNVVLRVLPPFAGRMRARLHIVGGDEEDGAVHFHPGVKVNSAVFLVASDDVEPGAHPAGEWRQDTQNHVPVRPLTGFEGVEEIVSANREGVDALRVDLAPVAHSFRYSRSSSPPQSGQTAR